MSLDELSNANFEDKELQQALQVEQQKLSFQTQVLKLTDTCWEKCVTDKPSTRLDGRTETCITNCVERFIDASIHIQKRFGQLLEKSVQGRLDN